MSEVPKRGRHSTGSTVKIEEYSFGRIIVGGKEYAKDLIIYPDGVKPEWWRREGHLLHLEDIEEVLKYRPEVLVIGTGAYGMMKVPESVKRELILRGVEIMVRRTDEACKEFNKMVELGRRVVAALHLTC